MCRQKMIEVDKKELATVNLLPLHHHAQPFPNPMQPSRRGPVNKVNSC